MLVSDGSLYSHRSRWVALASLGLDCCSIRGAQQGAQHREQHSKALPSPLLPLSEALMRTGWAKAAIAALGVWWMFVALRQSGLIGRAVPSASRDLSARSTTTAAGGSGMYTSFKFEVSGKVRCPG